VVDPYTTETRRWLDERFQQVDNQGIYVAHQPIYGFQGQPSEPSHLVRYIRTWAILRALTGLKFHSALDVGGAEGYTAHLLKALMKVEVIHCDLSEQACRRAREIYSLMTQTADIHSLPYAADSFDAVVCSETLEHVIDRDRALSELMRVAKRVVVITVPHEPISTVEANIAQRTPHAHIHNFNLASFDHLREQGFGVKTRRIVSPGSRILGALVDGRPVSQRGRPLVDALISVFNTVAKPIARLAGRPLISLLIRLDAFLLRLIPGYRAVSVVILKKPELGSDKAERLSLRVMLGRSVRPHRLKMTAE
jgi:SAM-dependent methyltransferase